MRAVPPAPSPPADGPTNALAPPAALEGGPASAPFAQVALGWLIVVATDAVVLSSRMRGVPVGSRLAAHAFAGAQLLILGALMAIGATAWSRAAEKWPRLRARPLPYVALFAAACLLGALILREDVSGLADTLAKTTALRRQPIWMVILVGACAATWPLVAAVAWRISRTPVWPIGALAAVAVTAANGMDHDYPDIHLIVTPSYPGMHVLFAVIAATLAAAAIPPSFRGVRFLVTRPRARVAQIALGVVAILGLTIWPSNQVTLLLERHLGAVLLLSLIHI